MGKAITCERVGFYAVTERGTALLQGQPFELKIAELR